MAVVLDYPHPTSAAVSRVMRGNRRRDTRPEVRLRSLLHARGRRFRKDLRIALPGGSWARPDIAFTRARVAVFVDGCFWHGCPTHGTQPRANEAYWMAKIARNKARDHRNDEGLAAAGWSVVRVWEHESLDAARERVEVALDRSG